MLYQALMVGLVMFIGNFSDSGLSDPMIRRPIVMSTLVGVFLGDLTTGLMVGALLEVIFLGMSGIGGAMPTDSMTGSILGTSLAILSNQGVEVALLLSIPIGLISVYINQIGIFIRGKMLNAFNNYVNDNRIHSIDIMQIIGAFVGPVIYGSVGFLTIITGGNAISILVNSLPVFIMNGLTVATTLLPSLGIALAINMIYEKGTFIFLILGFILAAYLKLPLTAIAVLGLVMTVIISVIDKQLIDLKNNSPCANSVTVNQSENNLEEDFFNE